MNRAVCLAVLLAACGVSEKKYQKKYHERYCAACEGEDGFECPPLGELFAAADQCDYDAGLARECLKGEWTCNTDFAPIIYADPPLSCEEVYVCSTESQG